MSAPEPTSGVGSRYIDIDPIGFTHMEATMSDHTDTVTAPLCFINEARRKGDHAELVVLTFDQALEPDDYPTVTERDRVSCPDCREWMSA